LGAFRVVIQDQVFNISIPHGPYLLEG
jgi:hypothetical protein